MTLAPSCLSAFRRNCLASVQQLLSSHWPIVLSASSINCSSCCRSESYYRNPKEPKPTTFTHTLILHVRDTPTPGRWVMVPNFLPVRIWYVNLENFYFFSKLYQWTNHNCLFNGCLPRFVNIEVQTIHLSTGMGCPWPQNTHFHKHCVLTTSCIWFVKTLMVTYVWTPLVCFVDTSNPSDWEGQAPAVWVRFLPVWLFSCT